MSACAAQPQCNGQRRRPLLAAAMAACGLAAGRKVARGFVVGGATARPRHGGRGHTSAVARQAQEYVEMTANAGLAGFQGSEWSLWTTFACFAVSLPGVYSTIQRTGQAKFVEKTYVMPGTAAGGLEMRSIAGGVVAYFKGLNYSMENAPATGKIRFVGNMQGSISQALYLVACVLGAVIALGFVLQSLLPDGPFGLGPNFWYLPAIVSPYAGWYYWGRAFRQDVVELQLEMSEDLQTTTLSTIGDQETIEALQKGVRFQSPEGRLFQLMERGMEYQPGIFESTENVTIIKEKEAAPKAEALATNA
mmetsp:Transcript_32068/g.72787  ORF Transcript_32068/g.72787 Transcript_32068/m.72787 type:complete len:306 (+) Transcript_32068:96-1013(+)